jgi:Domain of unknown function (DUF6970)
MKSLILFLILVGIFLLTSPSCKKEKPVFGCCKEDPINNLDWLKSRTNYYDTLTSNIWDVVNIYMYDYNKSNAFQFETKKAGISDVPITIANCDGRAIFICGGLQPPQLDSCNIFFNSASNKRLIWSKTYK